MTAAEVTAGAVVELSCGCIGQRATAPISTDPQFVIKASCQNHAPGDIIAADPVVSRFA
jgi:hypothetical protein